MILCVTGYSQNKDSLDLQNLNARMETSNEMNSWWKSLDNEWKNIFKKAVNFKGEPTSKELNLIFSLERLDCRNTRIKDLEPLEKLTKLKELRIDSTDIKSLKSISDLKELKRLSFNSTKVSDLSPLIRLENLNVLACQYTNVSDLTPICGLPIVFLLTKGSLVSIDERKKFKSR